MRCKKCLFGGIICDDDGDTLINGKVMCPYYASVDDDKELEEVVRIRRAEFYEDFFDILTEEEEW